MKHTDYFSVLAPRDVAHALATVENIRTEIWINCTKFVWGAG